MKPPIPLGDVDLDGEGARRRVERAGGARLVTVNAMRRPIKEAW
jgi:hypothetical protein